MSEPTNSLRSIFNEAVEMTDAAEREAFLEQACAHNPALRQRIADLLQAHEHTGSFLEKQPPAVAAYFSVPFTEKPGDTIGRYKLLQQIGEGGCGVVYLAEQQEPFHRRVALKVIKLGMDTKSVIARFEAERQALALMDHPNIAKVFDAGATQTGRPYFVMELVRGIKITDYCDQHNLSAIERLKLFTQVCHAIQHAHQKGVIHRDIKPSNILVSIDDSGSAEISKVIDFGIAKATTDQTLTGHTVLTAFQQFIGTPAYMSPEQAMMSQDVDTRTDIYALGVLLYELLTGKTPFDANDLMAAGLDTMRRIIREKEPVRPSTRLSMMLASDLTVVARHRQAEPAKLGMLLRGDLDWVVMKTLEKDRGRRYETANGLAMDIDRYLANEPVAARPPSAVYRFQKFVRRNKLTFIAANAVAAALVIGLGGALWQWRRAERLAQGESQQRFLAETKEARIHLNLYAADISLAAHAIERGDYGLARSTLAGLLPATGEADLRGFEWRYLWNICQGNQLAILGSHGWIVTCAAFSPDGKLIATGSQDGTVKLWTVAQHELVATLSGLKSVWSVGFSPDGKLLMAGTTLGVRIWNSETRQPSGNFRGEIAALSKTGSLIAIADSSPFYWEQAGPVSLWDYHTGKKLRDFDQAGRSLALSADNKTLAVAGPTSGVNLWDVASGRLLRTLPTEDSVWALNFSPDGKKLVVVGWANKPMVWTLENTQLPEYLKASHLNTWSASFSPDGSTIMTTSSDQTIHLWDANTLESKNILRGHENEVWCAAFSPDGEFLVSGGKDKRVMLWPAHPRARPHVLPNSNRTRPIFSPDSTRIVTVVATGEPSRSALWNVGDCTTVVDIPGNEVVGFSADGSQMISWARNENPSERLSLTNRTINSITLEGVGPGAGTFWPCGLSPDQKILFAINRAGVIRFWDSASGHSLGVIQGPEPPIRAAVLGPAGKYFAVSVERENLVRLFERATGREMQLTGHRDFVGGLAFSPDGASLASGSVDGTIRLWNTTTGNQTALLPGHLQDTTDVAFSPDGRTLASIGQRDSIKLWHLLTQRELLSLDFPHAGMCVQFSPDGRYLAVGTDENTLHFFEAPY